ncbi:MAG: hypothetical protein EOO10_06170 [Chitinophagaceae bacterium]|nr:MAG: hypothetical protein EOO10_06170 [Chitinophagaceae bacterium]
MKNTGRALLTAVFALIGFTTITHAQSFTKDGFYEAMSSDKPEALDQQLDLLKSWTGTEKQAYRGALTMKKAGYVSGAGKKLRTFKAGNKDLEGAINIDKDNVEYRFLRLMIQEHAPGILGYNDDLQADSDYIRKSFKNLHPAARQAVIDYTKTKSKYLSEKDFN